MKKPPYKNCVRNPARKLFLHQNDVNSFTAETNWFTTLKPSRPCVPNKVSEDCDCKYFAAVFFLQSLKETRLHCSCETSENKRALSPLTFTETLNQLKLRDVKLVFLC